MAQFLNLFVKNRTVFNCKWFYRKNFYTFYIDSHFQYTELDFSNFSVHLVMPFYRYVIEIPLDFSKFLVPYYRKVRPKVVHPPSAPSLGYQIENPSITLQTVKDLEGRIVFICAGGKSTWSSLFVLALLLFGKLSWPSLPKTYTTTTPDWGALFCGLYALMGSSFGFLILKLHIC